MANKLISKLNPGERCRIGLTELYLRKIIYPRGYFGVQYYFCEHNPLAEPFNKTDFIEIVVKPGKDFEVELL